MPTNDFLPFAPTDTGTNLLSQADYSVASDRTNGNQPGVASSKLNNKAIRQSSYVVSQIAQFISNQLGQDVLDNATPSALLAQIASAFQSPSGTVTMFGGATAPGGWLLCDGSAVSRTTYATLFALLGTTYGVGDGSTTFNLPNTQGVFVRGAGSQTISTIAYTGARGTVQGDQMQAHTHAPTSGAVIFTNSNGPQTQNASGSNAGFNSLGDPVQSSGGPTRIGSETRPANIVLAYIIKT